MNNNIYKDHLFDMKQSTYRILIITILFCALSIVINAQEGTPFHSTFTTEDGLPSNRIYDIMKDSKGYIWVGTDNGLVRFNGKEFKEYTTSESLNSEYSYLHELKDGSIWCVNFGNQVFKVSKDSLEVVDAFTPYLTDKRYFKLYEWKDSLLYLENRERIVEYNPFSKKIREIIHSPRYAIYSFCRNSDYIFYSIQGSKYHENCRLSLHDQTIQIKKTDDSSFIYGHNDIYIRYSTPIENTQKQDGYIYSFEISPSDSDSKETPILTIKNSFLGINSISNLGKDNVWINTINGAYNTSNKSYIFKNNSITRIIKDNEQNTWIATYDSGLFLVPNLDIIQNNQIKSSISTIENIYDSKILLGLANGYIYTHDPIHNQLIDSFFIESVNTKSLPVFDQKRKLIVHSPKSYTIDLTQKLKSSKKYNNFTLKNFKIIDDHFLIQLDGSSLLILHNNFFLNGERKTPNIELSEQWTFSKGSGKILSHYYLLKLNKTSAINIHYEASQKRIWFANNRNTAIEQNQRFTEFKLDEGKDLLLNCFANHIDGGIIAAQRRHGLVFILEDSILFKTNHKKYEEFGPIRKIITTDSLIISLLKPPYKKSG